MGSSPCLLPAGRGGHGAGDHKPPPPRVQPGCSSSLWWGNLHPFCGPTPAQHTHQRESPQPLFFQEWGINSRWALHLGSPMTSSRSPLDGVGFPSGTSSEHMSCFLSERRKSPTSGFSRTGWMIHSVLCCPFLRLQLGTLNRKLSQTDCAPGKPFYDPEYTLHTVSVSLSGAQTSWAPSPLPGLQLPDVSSISLHAWDAWNCWGLAGKQRGFGETRVRFSFLSDRRNLLPDTALLCTSRVYSPFCHSSFDCLGCHTHWSRCFLPRSCSVRTGEVEDAPVKMSLLIFELMCPWNIWERETQAQALPSGCEHPRCGHRAGQWMQPVVFPTPPRALYGALGRICSTPRVRLRLLERIRLIFTLHSLLKLDSLDHVWFWKLNRTRAQAWCLPYR